jgi:hypothetical protein
MKIAVYAIALNYSIRKKNCYNLFHKNSLKDYYAVSCSFTTSHEYN